MHRQPIGSGRGGAVGVLRGRESRLVEASFTNGNVSGRAAESVHDGLREAAKVMHALQQQWETVTSATRPGHEYVTATTNLHASLSAIEREILRPDEEVDVTTRVDVDWALADLRYAATDLVELTHSVAQLPEPLIRSEQLFAPARILPSTMERVHDRNHGRYVAIRLTEGTALINAARDGSKAAQQVRATLEISIGPIGATELSTHSHAPVRRREIEPATGLGGPGLVGYGACCHSHRYRVRLTAGQTPVRPAPRGRFALAGCRRPADLGRRMGRTQRECPPQGLRRVRLWPR